MFTLLVLLGLCFFELLTNQGTGHSNTIDFTDPCILSQLANKNTKAMHPQIKENNTKPDMSIVSEVKCFWFGVIISPFFQIAVFVFKLCKNMACFQHVAFCSQTNRAPFSKHLHCWPKVCVVAVVLQQNAICCKQLANWKMLVKQTSKTIILTMTYSVSDHDSQHLYEFI